MTSGKRVLIIGAGFLQSFVIERAKALGYRVLAVDRNPHSPGFRHADAHGVIDIRDEFACLRYAQDHRVDGVMTAATDYGVLSTSFVAQKMGLPGLDYATATLLRDKHAVRRLLAQHRVDSLSQFYAIQSKDDIDRVISRIRYPVIVKPADGAGSRAVTCVRVVEQLRTACDRALGSSLVGKALIEDYVEGKEYGMESFVLNGETHVLGVLDKTMTPPPYYAELGHAMPTGLGTERQAIEIGRLAISSLGINFGAVNMDLIVTNEGRTCIIDIGARMGGNLIGSHVIPTGTGIDYMGNLIRAAVGDPTNLLPERSPIPVATRILALSPGTIRRVPNIKKIESLCGVDIFHNLKIGDIIREYHSNLDGCGYIVATANSVAEAQHRVGLALELINEGIIRD